MWIVTAAGAGLIAGLVAGYVYGYVGCYRQAETERRYMVARLRGYEEREYAANQRMADARAMLADAGRVLAGE